MIDRKVVGLYIVDDLCWRFVGIEMLAGCVWVVWGARSYVEAREREREGEDDCRSAAER